MSAPVPTSISEAHCYLSVCVALAPLAHLRPRAPTPSIPFPYPYRAQPYLIPPADPHTRMLTTLMFRAGVEAHTVTTHGVACYAQNLVEVSRIPVLHYITLTPAARPPHTHQRPRRPSLSTLVGRVQASDDVHFCGNTRREGMRCPFRIWCWTAAECRPHFEIHNACSISPSSCTPLACHPAYHVHDLRSVSLPLVRILRGQRAIPSVRGHMRAIAWSSPFLVAVRVLHPSSMFN